METNLQHEDLLIQLRSKLNEEKIKLWEPPYLQPENEVSQSLQDLAKKYAAELSTPYDVILQALQELQLHSIDRSKANAEFQETGFATFRVKAMLPGEKPRVMKVQKKLNAMGSDLIATVAAEINISENRVKLIFNGKVIKPTPSLEEQGVKNGAQIMALVMAESPEEVRKEDNMYMEMKSTRDDALLLTECMDDDVTQDEEYMNLEDQSGNAIELPPAERRSLMVGLALHERGREAAKKHDYPLALVLYLEADRQFNECRSSLLKSVDNWALLQLDIAWCYLCLQNLSLANDAATRLARAEESLRNSYGENHERLIALKGTAANERVLIMRLHLLQGIVAYHQNQRAEARRLLEKAERDLEALRVDENHVSQLVELGWSSAAARRGLRAAGGDINAAHLYLSDRRAEKQRARAVQRAERQRRLLGLCEDGSPVSQKLVEGLVAMGFSRSLAIVALRNSNNHAAEAVRLIQEQPEMLEDSDISSSDSETPSSDDSTVEPDNRLVAELEAMGYCPEEARAALRLCRNRINDAVDLLIAGAGRVQVPTHDQPISEASASNPTEPPSTVSTLGTMASISELTEPPSTVSTLGTMDSTSMLVEPPSTVSTLGTMDSTSMLVEPPSTVSTLGTMDSISELTEPPSTVPTQDQPISEASTSNQEEPSNIVPTQDQPVSEASASKQEEALSTVLTRKPSKRPRDPNDNDDDDDDEGTSAKQIKLQETSVPTQDQPISEASTSNQEKPSNIELTRKSSKRPRDPNGDSQDNDDEGTSAKQIKLQETSVPTQDQTISEASTSTLKEPSSIDTSKNGLSTEASMSSQTQQSIIGENSANPSTSAGVAAKRHKKPKTKKRSKRKERQMALDRLSASIRHEDEDHLDTSLVEEEQFLVRYKSLL